MSLFTGAAGAFSPDSVPEPLRPWVDWVLYGQPEARCPVLYNQVTRHRCAWPGALTLELDRQGGRFEQRWTVDAESWLDLPGDRRHWPQEVQIDGSPVPVLERAGRPILKAAQGEHTVSGYFLWQDPPESLQLAPDTALLSLTVQGKPVADPRVQDNGVLWLRKRAEPAQEDHLELQIARRITDTIPLTLTTRLTLQVSGQAREERLGRALPEGFIPLALDSPLPARLEPDGRLRVQVRPGTWTLELYARSPGPLDALALPEPDGPWAGEELWVFQAQPSLRIVTVEGAPSIDPAQTALPEDWRQWPVYRLEPGGSLRLITRKRGDSDPAPDRLSLEKTLWLDFAGRGYTVQDRLSGTVSRSSRLEVRPGVHLGRVAIDGQSQFITHLPDSPLPGVEVRQGTLQLTADSRLEPRDIGRLPAVGWQISPLTSRVTLNLPPGWRLLSAGGPDSVSETWLYRWNLLDIFIVLLTALSFGRLWGWPYGVLALLGLTLTYQEPNAPRLLWLNVLAAIALLRVLPPGRLYHVLDGYRRLAVLALLAMSLVFAVQQVRSALYPQLMPVAVFTAALSVPGGDSVLPQAEPPPAEGVIAGRQAPATPASSPAPSRLKQQYTPDIKVQTGPGLPTWQWHPVVFVWNSPVTADQALELRLLPPWATRLLMLIGVGLLAAMLIRATLAGPLKPLRLRSGSAALLIVPALLASASEARAEPPSAALLEELRNRLLAAPDCQPVCAALSRLSLQLAGDELALRLELDSQVATAVPLPFPAKHLTPRRITLEQQPVPLYRDNDGRLWARLPAGRHVLEIETSLPASLTTLQIPLPMTPGRVELAVEGWSSEGVDQDTAAGQIQLSRRQPGATPLQPGVMPPFVQVERTVELAIDWQVHTRVQRLSQADSAALLEIPLLPGERVTTPGIPVRDHRVWLSLPPEQAALGWSSTLEKSERLDLKAAATTQFVEIWQLRAGALWHVETSGIPMIHRYDESGRWLPQWRPWPGESLTLLISRPFGVEGKTVTIDRAQLQLNPGQRATEAALELVIRSGRGTAHTLTLPPGAQLTGVMIDGRPQPIEQNGPAVVLPLLPGTQTVSLTWRHDQGISTHYRTPAVDLGSDSVNNRIILNLPANRWTLFAGGPRLGPAVLFWGVLIVIASSALLLGRFGGTPLKAHDWFLLGAGLSQAGVWTSLLVAGWLLLLGRRPALGERLGNLPFNLLQALLVLLTLAALAAMLGAIQQGLLGSPEMQITGNGSSAYHLHWYQDRSPGPLPRAWVVSVPILGYRLLMLAWALWLAFALLKWLGWAWKCFASGGLWRRLKLHRAGRPAPPLNP